MKRTGLGDIGDFITHRLGLDSDLDEEGKRGEIDTDRQGSQMSFVNVCTSCMLAYVHV